MARLLLRGVGLGEVKAVLFDKDGTLSISEPQLITLAEARVFLCLERVEPALRPELGLLLRRAYGLLEAADGMARSRICPAGITAVASRDHNLIATATALVQVGLGWPEALSLSEVVFALADRIDARRAAHPVRPIHADRATALRGPGANPGSSAGGVFATNQGGGATPASRSAAVAPGDATAGALPSAPAGAGDERQGSDTGRDFRPVPAGLVTHLDSAGQPIGGTSCTTEGLRPWLEQLQAASLPCAVISNDDVAGIEHFLATHELEGFFCAIWSAEHSPRKPDPAAVHGLCAELGLKAADCALIGDANSDLRMAVAAGIPHQLALGYTAAWSTPPPLAEPHPRVHHWRELSLA